jgi:uncharacterized protein (UPF0332 family)
VTEAERHLAKARESLASARADVRARRYNSAANRAYYAAFQAAVAALIQAEIRPENDDWSHRFVMSQFSGRLIRRRKLLPPAIRSILPDLFNHRVRADYGSGNVSARHSRGASERAARLVAEVSEALGQGAIREARSAYGSKQMKTTKAVKAKARELIQGVEQAILQEYPDCEFKAIERGPKDYRLIVRSDRADLDDIHRILDGRTADILVDHDIWIVILAESKREAA